MQLKTDLHLVLNSTQLRCCAGPAIAVKMMAVQCASNHCSERYYYCSGDVSKDLHCKQFCKCKQCAFIGVLCCATHCIGVLAALLIALVGALLMHHLPFIVLFCIGENQNILTYNISL